MVSFGRSNGIFVHAGLVEGIDKKDMVTVHGHVVEFNDLARERKAGQEDSVFVVDLESEVTPGKQNPSAVEVD